MKRYYIKFVGWNHYILVDRFYNDVVIGGTLDMVNAKADEIGDCDECIEY